jgi:fibro-slime domain-containing protein
MLFNKLWPADRGLFLKIKGGFAMAGYLFEYRKLRKSFTNPWFMLGLRLFLGLIFLVSATLKLLNQADFISTVVGYNLLPNGLAVFYGSVLPWLELLIGILLVFGWLVKLASGMSLAMLVSFMVANIYAIMVAQFDVNCGCFGSSINMGHTASLSLDIAMLLTSLHLLLKTGLSRSKPRAGQSSILRLNRSIFLYASKVIPVVLAIAIVTPATLFLPGGNEAQAKSSQIITSSITPLRAQINNALESGKKAFLYFYREGCHYCEGQAPIINSLEQEYQGVEFIRLEASSEIQAFKEFGVNSVPSMFLVSAKDKGDKYVLQSFKGLTGEDTLRQAFDSIAAGEDGYYRVAAQIANPWDTTQGQACFVKWINESMSRLNAYNGDAEFNARKPWSINQYGVTEGNPQLGPTSVYAPDDFAQHNNNRYWWMWDHYPNLDQWTDGNWRGAGVPLLRPYVSNCVSAATGVTTTTSPSSAGLLGYWKMNEGDGTAIRDYSGLGNNGTLKGTPSWINWDASGTSGSLTGAALKFDGSSNYVLTPVQFSQLSNGMTWMAWARHDDRNMTWSWVFSEDSNDDIMSQIGKVPQGGNVRFELKGVGTLDTTGVDIADGQSHHIAGVWEKGVGLKIYIDGAIKATSPILPGSLTATKAIRIGAKNDSWSAEKWKGLIANAAIFNRALNQSEIQSAMGGSSLPNSTVTSTPNPTPTTSTSISGPTSGLVAYYPFDGDYNDRSGNGNNGTAKGSMSFAPGVIAQGANFDGKSWIEVNDSSSLDLSTAFTLSTWLNKTDAGTAGWAVVLCKGDTSALDNSTPYALDHTPDGLQPSVRLTKDNSYTNIDSAVRVDFKKWYLLSVTWDGQNVKFYIDGVLKDTRTWQGTLPNSSAKLLIGSDPAGATEYFRGVMDDLRIYNRALSAAEIAQIPGSSTPNPTPAASPTPGSTLVLPVTIRDFLGIGSAPVSGYSNHQDFEATAGDDRGIVQKMLGADKKPVYSGQTGHPTTHGQAAFDQWFRDTPGVNMKKDTTLTLTWDGKKYVYENSSFFPIDGQLLGNYLTTGHNFHFTIEMHTRFTYQGGETYNFVGDDDVWVYINNQLVIDLGGQHPPESASVALDTLGLTRGNTYDLDLYYAERHTTGSTIRIETTVDMKAAPLPTSPTPTPATSPTSTPSSSGTAAVSLSWVDFGQDKVDRYTSTPNKTPDGHFRVNLTVNGSKSVQRMFLYTSDQTGNPALGQYWDSAPNTNGTWILGVLRNGTLLNAQPSLLNDPVSGQASYDVFGDNSGYFNPGQFFGITVFFTDGTSVKAVTSLPSSVPTVTPTPTPTPAAPPASTPPPTGSGSIPGTNSSLPPFGNPQPNTNVQRMSIQVAQRRVISGELVQVPVWLITASNVANMNFELSFSASVAKPEGTSSKGNLLDNSLFSVNSNDSGIIRAGFAGTAGVSGTGTVMTVPFRAVGKPGDRTLINISVTTLNDPTGKVLTIDRIPGEIVILDSKGEIPGSTGTPATTGIPPGDCDGDGVLTFLDAVCALEMSVKLQPARLVLDIDKSGDVTSRDATIIAQRVVGKP